MRLPSQSGAEVWRVDRENSSVRLSNKIGERSTMVQGRFSVGSSKPYACGFQESEKMKHDYLQI